MVCCILIASNFCAVLVHPDHGDVARQLTGTSIYIIQTNSTQYNSEWRWLLLLLLSIFYYLHNTNEIVRIRFYCTLIDCFIRLVLNRLVSTKLSDQRRQHTKLILEQQHI